MPQPCTHCRLDSRQSLLSDKLPAMAIRHFELLACAAMLCGGCSQSSPDVSLASVSPTPIMAGQEIELSLHGAGFFGDLSVDLSGDESASVDTSFEVGIGNLVLLDVGYIDSSQVTVMLPATLEVGVYNVRLTTPGREETILQDALEVVAILPTADAGATGDGGMSIRDAAMAGAPVATFADDLDAGGITIGVGSYNVAQ